MKKKEKVQRESGRGVDRKRTLKDDLGKYTLRERGKRRKIATGKEDKMKIGKVRSRKERIKGGVR